MPATAASSPYDRIMRRRRRTFVRDWILVLIALGLAIASGVVRPHHIQAPASAAAPPQPAPGASGD